MRELYCVYAKYCICVMCYVAAMAISRILLATSRFSYSKAFYHLGCFKNTFICILSNEIAISAFVKIILVHRSSHLFHADSLPKLNVIQFLSSMWMYDQGRAVWSGTVMRHQLITDTTSTLPVAIKR